MLGYKLNFFWMNRDGITLLAFRKCDQYFIMDIVNFVVIMQNVKTKKQKYHWKNVIDQIVDICSDNLQKPIFQFKFQFRFDFTLCGLQPCHSKNRDVKRRRFLGKQPFLCLSFKSLICAQPGISGTVPDAHLEPSRRSKMELFCEKPLTIFAKSSILMFDWVLKTPLAPLSILF